MARTLGALAEETKLELSREAEGSLRIYLEELERWGRAINLTADPRPEIVLTRQLPDAFHLASLLHPLEPGSRCVDVGAGAGLVGIPFAILSPGIALTLVESNQRKSAFLRAMVHRLGLTAEVRAERLEALPRPIHSSFDLALSRATWSPQRWLEEGRRLASGAVAVFSREPLGEGHDRLAQRLYEIEGSPRCLSIWRAG